MSWPFFMSSLSRSLSIRGLADGWLWLFRFSLLLTLAFTLVLSFELTEPLTPLPIGPLLVPGQLQEPLIAPEPEVEPLTLPEFVLTLPEAPVLGEPLTLPLALVLALTLVLLLTLLLTLLLLLVEPDGV